MRDREQLLAFCRSYTGAWNSNEPTRVTEHFAPDATIAINGGAPTPIRDIANAFMADFPEMELRMGDVLTRDDGVVEYHWTLIGDHTGTGNHVHISGFEEWTPGDDEPVAGSLGNFDAAEYERQVAHGADRAG